MAKVKNNIGILCLIAGIIFLIPSLNWPFLIQLFRAQTIPLPANTLHVLRVEEKSPAEEAGLRRGDEIIAVNDVRLADESEYFQIINTSNSFVFTIQRDNGSSEIIMNIDPQENYIAVTGAEIAKVKDYPATIQNKARYLINTIKNPSVIRIVNIEYLVATILSLIIGSVLLFSDRASRHRG